MWHIASRTSLCACAHKHTRRTSGVCMAQSHHALAHLAPRAAPHATTRRSSSDTRCDTPMRCGAACAQRARALAAFAATQQITKMCHLCSSARAAADTQPTHHVHAVPAYDPKSCRSRRKKHRHWRCVLWARRTCAALRAPVYSARMVSPAAVVVSGSTSRLTQNTPSSCSFSNQRDDSRAPAAVGQATSRSIGSADDARAPHRPTAVPGGQGPKKPNDSIEINVPGQAPFCLTLLSARKLRARADGTRRAPGACARRRMCRR
jgi:hypothetical protein